MKDNDSDDVTGNPDEEDSELNEKQPLQRPSQLKQRTVSGSSAAMGGRHTYGDTVVKLCRMAPFVVSGQPDVQMRRICFDQPPTDDFTLDSP